MITTITIRIIRPWRLVAGSADIMAIRHMVMDMVIRPAGLGIGIDHIPDGTVISLNTCYNHVLERLRQRRE